MIGGLGKEAVQQHRPTIQPWHARRQTRCTAPLLISINTGQLASQSLNLCRAKPAYRDHLNAHIYERKDRKKDETRFFSC